MFFTVIIVVITKDPLKLYLYHRLSCSKTFLMCLKANPSVWSWSTFVMYYCGISNAGLNYY